jgi:hypothetical protein
VATSRWVTDFSICESCCWGCIVGQQLRCRGHGAEWGIFTFLGARLWDPCEERTEEASSVMMRPGAGVAGRGRCEGARGHVSPMLVLALMDITRVTCASASPRPTISCPRRRVRFKGDSKVVRGLQS